MKSMISGAVLAPGVALALLSSIQSASAATLTLDATARVNGSVFNINLSAPGNTDWAYWASNTGNSIGTTAAPTNDKATGGTIISDLSAVGGGFLRGSSTADDVGSYSWTGGSLAGFTTGTNANLDGGLVFNSQLGNSSLDKGFSLTIAGTALTNNYAVLYLGGFGATGKLTLTLAGATTVIDTSAVFSSVNPKSIVAYQVKFNPDTASDRLTVQYTATAPTDATSGHVGIDAVSVGTASVIPEPASALLGAFGGLLLLGRRRRNR